MRVILLDMNTFVIASVLFGAMALAMELSHRMGLARYRSVTEQARSHVNAIQASMLGVLALVLGFAFARGLQRFDTRHDDVVDEANAIGTAYLRAQMLPDAVGIEMRQRLQDYVALRVDDATLALAQTAERREVNEKTNAAVDAIWALARRAAEVDSNEVPTGLFIRALNEAIDSFGRRESGLRRQAPALVMVVLFGSFVMTAVAVGFSAGVSGHRPSGMAYMLIGLLVVLAFIIIDLERPRRGLIQVDKTILLELKSTIDSQEALLRKER